MNNRSGSGERTSSVQESRDRSSLLASKVALVTGGASGIGAAICTEFAAHGAAIAIADVDGSKADRMVEQLGGAKSKVMSVAADVAHFSQAEAAAAATLER